MKKIVYTILIISFCLTACVSETSETETIIPKQEQLPLREIKDINVFVEQIKADSNWSSLISKKADEAGKTFDEMITIDAQYLQDMDAEIVTIENEIIQNEEWLNTIRQKAESQNVNLNQAIRADAEFMYNERLKVAK